MAAVIDLSTARRVAGSSRPLRGTAAPIGRSRAATAPAILPTPQRQLPELRLIEGGRSERVVRRRQMYLRRRLLALTVAVLALLAAVRVVGVATSALASALATEPVATQAYEVRPGDTLWSVAGRFLPGGDRRDAVARLADLNPTVVSAAGGVQAGDVLRVPAR
ncbi:MAG: LysM peptidoglycan-binding domain-containing protein [Actinomycetes bacterium]